MSGLVAPGSGRGKLHNLYVEKGQMAWRPSTLETCWFATMSVLSHNLGRSSTLCSSAAERTMALCTDTDEINSVELARHFTSCQ